MSDSFETTIKNFSGKSTETKPTIAAGNTVPNGSRWREVDTSKTYFFNLADDAWYEVVPSVSLVDDAGNPVDSHADADGGYHLGASVIQTIISSTSNSTGANLASGATFTGAADETFGVNGIQVIHYADKDCAIYIDQSLDNTFSVGVITDSFTCLASNACSRTFQSVAPYYRARVTNTDTAATTVISFATGMTPIINPLPRALSPDGHLLTESTLTGQQNTDRHVWVSHTNAMATVSEVRLVGTNFDGQTKDPNFWTETVTGSGTVTQDGEIQLDTGVTANSTAKYTSVRKARFVVGSANHFTGAFKFVTAGTADNVRRCGAYLVTDGFFFQLDGTVFSIGTRKNSSDTLVSSGSFNGNYGVKFTPLTTAYYKLDIEWTPVAVFFYINGVLLHKVGGGHLSDILTLPIAFENVNDNGSIVDVAFDCLGVVILREGELTTSSTYKYIAGAATNVLKYGAGTLHIIVNNDNSGSVIVYDNTVAGGTIIASIDLAKVLGTLTFDAPFSSGLTVVSTGAGAKITVTYE